MSANPIVVIGAGAAGLMAAIHAAGGERPVVLLEGTKDGGRKILIAGGGRCNVLPSVLDPGRFVTDSSPNSLRRMLQAWPLAEQIRFFDDVLGLQLTLEPETGKLFPASNRARDVRDALVRHARQKGVEIRFSTLASRFEPQEADWRVHLAGGDPIHAAAVIVATGGLSVPATGSDGRGLGILRGLGVPVHETYPALTPLTADPPVHAGLAGISLEVGIRVPLEKGVHAVHGGFLFTHRGYSGPAVLDVSHHAVRARREGRAQPLLVQWTAADEPEWDARLRAPGAGEVGPLLRRYLPDRLAEMLLAEAGVAHDTRLAQLRREERARLVGVLTAWEIPWSGDEGYRKAEVTGGGVALSAVHTSTLEARGHPGLYLCGEILDAFGPIGGNNFAWAWSTGRTAGRAARARP